MTKHLRIFALIFCLLFAVSPAWAANNWAGSNAVCLWSLDNSPNDSIGGNTLLEFNTPSYDAGNKQEGSHAGSLDDGSSEIWYIVDNALDAGFPGSDGESEMDFSICFWVYFDELHHGTNVDGLVCKWQTTGNLRSWVINLSASDTIAFFIGYNAGTLNDGVAIGTACVVGRWYHVTATYTAASNTAALRVWDDTAGALLDTNESSVMAGAHSPRASYIEIGRQNATANTYVNALFDEIVVFAGEAISLGVNEDAHKIQLGTYGAAGSIVPLLMQYYHSEN